MDAFASQRKSEASDDKKRNFNIVANEKVIILSENEKEIVCAVYSTLKITSDLDLNVNETAWRIKYFPPDYKDYLFSLQSLNNTR